MYDIPERNDFVDPANHSIPIVYHCEICGEPIYDGDSYHYILGDRYCLDCITDTVTEAVFTDWRE